MKKDQKTEFDLVNMLTSIFKPKKDSQSNTEIRQASKKSIRPNHQPSWMYRNE